MFKLLILILNILIFSHCYSLKIFSSNLTSSSSYKLFYHRTGSFGPHEGTYNVSGELKLASPLELCSINQYRINNTSSYHQIYLNNIVLILRGNCTFSDKVYYSQLLGAQGVIIGDYNTSNDNDWIVMSKDDRDNNNIYIPSVFIQYNTYKWIKSNKNQNQNNNKIYAMLDSDGEYVDSPSTLWLFAFGLVIIVIPTLWCLIVCCATLRKKIINYILQSKRRKHLISIPIIKYHTNINTKTLKTQKTRISLSVLNTKSNTNDLNSKLVDSDTDIDSSPDVCAGGSAGAGAGADPDVDINRNGDNMFHNMSSFVLNQFKRKLNENENSNNLINDSCAICLEDFKLNELLRLLPCNHGFHKQCIDPWLSKQSELCPMCKQSIFINDSHSSSSWSDGLFKLCCIHQQQQQRSGESDDEEDQDDDDNNNDELVPIDSSSESDHDDNDNDNDNN